MFHYLYNLAIALIVSAFTFTNQRHRLGCCLFAGKTFIVFNLFSENIIKRELLGLQLIDAIEACFSYIIYEEFVPDFFNFYMLVLIRYLAVSKMNKKKLCFMWKFHQYL